MKTKTTTTKKPKVSVVMATYNARDYLRESVESILNQNFRDWEFLIIDDGSTDDTVSLIKSYKDPRIKLHQRRHQGLIATLNYGIKVAQGEYIARMDSDDVSEPGRFVAQVKFLDSHPEHVLVGTSTQVIDTRGRTIELSAEPLNHEEILQGLLVRNVLAHGSVMMRKDAVRKVGGYQAEALHAEDYDLWVRLAKIGKLANLPQALFKWRVNPFGISVTKSQIQRRTVERIKERQWKEILRSGVFPEISFADVLKKRTKPDLSDLFWRKRRASLTVIYSRLGRELILRGRRELALGPILAALILDPRWFPNYFYLLALLIPTSFIVPAENFFRPVKHFLAKIWHSIRLVSFIELPKGGILFVRRGIYPGFDFPEAHQFAEQLVKLRKNVGVVCLKSSRAEPSYEVVNGVKIFRLVPNSLFFRWVFQFLVLFNLWGRSFDVAHVFWGKGFSLLPIFARRSAKKWVLDIRSGHIGGPTAALVNNGLAVFDSYFFDHIITLDERLLKKLWRNSPKPRDLHFVPMGVNTEIFSPRNAGDLRKSLGLKKDDYVFVYQGTLSPLRQLDKFLRGFWLAQKTIPALKLLMVGDEGRNLERMRQAADGLGLGNSVTFTGRVPFEQVPRYIGAGDFAVSYIPQVPMFWNQQVTKTLEYLACERPVLATKLPFHEDLMRKEFGVLTDDDPESVAAAIKKMVKLQKQGRFKVKKEALAEHSWSRIVKDKLLPIYELK